MQRQQDSAIQQTFIYQSQQINDEKGYVQTEDVSCWLASINQYTWQQHISAKFSLTYIYSSSWQQCSIQKGIYTSVMLQMNSQQGLKSKIWDFIDCLKADIEILHLVNNFKFLLLLFISEDYQLIEFDLIRFNQYTNNEQFQIAFKMLLKRCIHNNKKYNKVSH
ncbi:unnamed protein product [Paramecium octaurelia]|uniref:Uncharacterized protein n=1 Tax=Paramecium octaurelia TaxID=43137 RepID=A0A8S1YJU2_PAROT|nr:unnamed protein product [Paramecium octaurelia]CAD8215565.1 unnamed protein product [Paramecium octaurelia]